MNVRAKAGYLLEIPELVSRSDAQFIAGDAGNGHLMEQIDGFRRPENPGSIVPYYWQDDDFSELMDVLKGLVINLGWAR